MRAEYNIEKCRQCKYYEQYYVKKPLGYNPIACGKCNHPTSPLQKGVPYCGCENLLLFTEKDLYDKKTENIQTHLLIINRISEQMKLYLDNNEFDEIIYPIK